MLQIPDFSNWGDGVRVTSVGRLFADAWAALKKSSD
jgi:hypothetical protein